MKKVILLCVAICFTYVLYSQVKVISNGNVGMGVSVPSEKLAINGNLRFEATNPYVYFASGNVTFRNLTSTNQILFQTGTTTRFAIVGSSYLSSNLAHRFLDGSASAPGIVGSGSGKTTSGLFWPTTNTLSFATGGTERMRIDANGNVGIGTTSVEVGEKVKINGSWGTALVLTVNHTADWQNSMKTIVNRANSTGYTLVYGNDVTFYVRGDGLVCSATGFYDWSDQSVKTNFASIENPVQKVMSLNGYYYDFSPEIACLQNSGRQIGLISQEVEAIVPEVVAVTMDGKKALDYSKLVTLLIEAFKEQQYQIEDLEQQLIQNQIDLQKCCPEYIFDKSFNNNTIEDSNDMKSNGMSYLSQNNPNPFNFQTVIEYNIAGDNSNGVIYIFDLQGKLIKTYSNLNPGKNSIIVNANELQPGMYMYSLIVDGKEIDTKRMILTQ
ncbi:MAG: tail fiber domain-containing protein [Bacteroidales bacterium]|nr:tail fiber domain-containing protein [Bacteroidales bacterium]